jgi:hypothetical protein
MDYFSLSWFSEYFCLIFHLWAWRSFSSIPSMDFGARTSLIIYLQPWSESMALAHSISWISPRSPKPWFLSSSKIGWKIIGFGEKPLLGTCSLCWGDPYVQVSFDLVHYSSRIKFGKKGADFGRKSCFLETSYRIMSGLTRQCPTWPG